MAVSVNLHKHKHYEGVWISEEGAMWVRFEGKIQSCLYCKEQVYMGYTVISSSTIGSIGVSACWSCVRAR